MTAHKYGVDAFYQSLINLKSYGKEVTVRGMTTTEILGHSFQILEPVARFMILPFRKCNPFAQLAEAIWMIAGRNDLDWLEFYIPSCKKWSDDGITWRDAYGPRLRNYGSQYEWSYNGWQPVGPVVDQIANAVNKLNQDIHSRQIILTIWNPMVDWIENSKAYPCNIALQFMVRNGYLHLFVTVRSNDVVYGFSHNDFFSWSLLLQMMAHWVGCKVGSLYWNATSFHIYDRHYELSQQIISKTPSRYFFYDYDVPTLGFSTPFDKIDDELERIFGWEKATEFITYCTELIDPNYMFTQDVLLDAIARMLLIYRYYKKGAHKDFIVSAVKAIGYSDFQLAAIDYLARDNDYTVADFGITKDNSEVMNYLMAIQQLQK